MNILITGGTGFVGKHLTKSLKKQGHHVFIITRSVDKHQNEDNETYLNFTHPTDTLPHMDAVINLAGDSLFGYWTKSKKKRILSSRIETTEKIIQFMKEMTHKPAVFISGSAVGFYGTSTEHIFTEKTETSGTDFLADVALKWEKSASQAEQLGIRTIFTRFGVILGDQGALPLMSLPVKLFAGGKIGSGEQWMSWVHVDDVVKLIVFCINNNTIQGPVNVTSPEPKSNKAFIKTLAKVLKRPYWLPTSAPLITLAMGEMSELITKGQYVLPQKAIDHGFEFLYPAIESALREINAS